MKVADPGGFALKGALRAGVVMPLGFVLGEVVIDNPQTGLFAAFGSIAILVFVEFGGSKRARLGGYVGLALAGAILIPLVPRSRPRRAVLWELRSRIASALRGPGSAPPGNWRGRTPACARSGCATACAAASGWRSRS